MGKKKKELKADAADIPEDIVQPITDAVLLEMAPATVKALFKKCKTPAARADFLYTLDKGELKKARDTYNDMDAFAKKLKAWFIQEFHDNQTGVTGKVGRVEVKQSEVPQVTDWDALYKHILKKKEWELMGKTIKPAAVAERWEQGKEVPGVGHFTVNKVSLTGVK